MGIAQLLVAVGDTTRKVQVKATGIYLLAANWDTSHLNLIKLTKQLKHLYLHTVQALELEFIITATIGRLPSTVMKALVSWIHAMVMSTTTLRTTKTVSSGHSSESVCSPLDSSFYLLKPYEKCVRLFNLV